MAYKKIIDCKTVEEALDLISEQYFGNISKDGLIHIFRLCNAYWQHSGNPKDPHAETTNGLCTNEIFDCLRVLKYIGFSKLFADQLASKIKRDAIFHYNLPPKWVIGSPTAGITFAHDITKCLYAPINMCVEKDPKNPKKMIWNRMTIPAGEPVLQIEELITTFYTTDEVQKAINEGNKEPVNFLPYIGVLVYRPRKITAYHNGRKIIALIEKEARAVPQEECPRCAKGSKRLRPKQHWEELTGKK